MDGGTEVLLYDSVDLSQIPSAAPAVAGYVDGAWANWADVLTKWPTTRHVSITATGRSQADVCDVEPGDVSAQGAVQWIDSMHRAGHGAPGIYASLDTWVTQLLPLLTRRWHRSQYRVWTAHWTGRWHRCGTECDRRMTVPVDATQFDNHALGRNLDASAALTTFFTHHAQGGSPAGR